MKVLIISANWGKGGPGGIAADLYQTLKNKGHECLFAYTRETVPENISAFRFGTMLDVYSHVIVSRLFDNAGFLSTRATRVLLRFIDQYKPDLISIQNPLGYTLNVGLLLNYIRIKNIPTVWTLHDCWAFSGHCTTDICSKLEVGCGNCPHQKEFPKSLFLDRSASNLQKKEKMFGGISNLHFIAPSNWIADLARKSYLKENEIITIPNGIDLSVFRPIDSNLRMQYRLDSKHVLLAVAGVWSNRKGAKYLYDLMRLLDNEYVLVMIGKNDFRDEACTNIIYVERTENREVLAEWYSTADVFVNPTMGDNFPTVNLESLACGTPVITFDTGGSAEAIGECGEVVPQEDVIGLTQAIKKCLSRSISTEQCVIQAQKYNRDDRYNDYVEYYEHLVKERR